MLATNIVLTTQLWKKTPATYLLEAVARDNQMTILLTRCVPTISTFLNVSSVQRIRKNTGGNTPDVQQSLRMMERLQEE